MDFEKEREMEDAGIDAFDFSLMDDDEKREALEDAGLDPDEYEFVIYDDSFDVWMSLQDHGVNLSDLDYMDFEKEREMEDAGIDAFDFSLMDDDEKREALENAGLDPDEYEFVMLEEEFDVWTYLQDEGVNLSDLDFIGYRKMSASEKAGISAITPPQMKYGDGIETAETTESGRVEREEISGQTQYPVYRPSTPAAQTFTYYEEPETSGSDERLPFLGVVLSIVMVILMFGYYGTIREKPTYYQPTYTTSSRSSSSNSPVPSVNRTPAMSAEEADRLRGTGYRGYRPYSFAENVALDAAQLTCKNCGYHTDNGANSLCDYCAWMERYGGGLPPSDKPKATSSSSQTTQNQSPSAKTKSDTETKSEYDPFHAEYYYDAEDFYDDYYDDFWDFEEAEAYWRKHH